MGYSAYPHHSIQNTPKQQRMIFIARNYKEKIIGIVSAADEKAVRAYYQGKGLKYNTLTPFDIEEDRENERMGFVTPILTTDEVVIEHNHGHFGSGGKVAHIIVR
jgi:hypothetical protein